MSEVLNKYGVLKNNEQSTEDYGSVDSPSKKLKRNDKAAKTIASLVEGDEKVFEFVK